MKIIICIFMAADHLAAVFPQTFPLWFRMVGRFSFVGFAFLVAEGCRKTGNIENYIFRLGLLAAVSEIFYDFCFGYGLSFTHNMNTVWTLFAGAAVIYCLTKVAGKILPLIYACCIIVSCLFLDVDYGVCGVLLIVMYYFCRSNIEIFISTALMFTIKYIRLIYPFSVYTIYWLFSVTACILPILYNNSRGKNIKYFFYVFYPLHLFIIGIFRLLGEFI